VIAELALRSNISLKIVELRLRKCFLQVAELQIEDSKKAVLCQTELLSWCTVGGGGRWGYLLHITVNTSEAVALDKCAK
jgi:hypothetical protein